MTQTAPPRAAALLRQRDIAGPFVVLFLCYFSLSTLLPIIPPLAGDLGAGSIGVGTAVAATSAAALLTRPVTGLLADRHGARPVLRAGAVAVAAGVAGTAWSRALLGLIVARLVAGLGEAAVFTAGAAHVMRRIPHQVRGRIVGLYGLCMWSGIAAGTALGAALLDHRGLALWVAIGVSWVAPVVIVRVLQRAPEPDASTYRVPEFSAALVPGLALACAGSGYAVLASFGLGALGHRGIAHASWVLTGFAGTYAAVRLLLGQLADRIAPRVLGACAGGVEVIGAVAVLRAHTLWLAVLGAALMAAGISLLHPSLALMAPATAELVVSLLAGGRLSPPWLAPGRFAA